MKQLLLVMLVCASFGAFAQKTNFSGNYKVNKSKVNWGPAPEYILPRYVKVDQLKDKVFISRVPLDQQLAELPAVIDTLDFKGSAFTKVSQGRKTVTVLKWLTDSSFELTKKSITEDNKPAGGVVETWTLEDGGKTLFINRDVEAANGMKYTTKAYFDKQ